MTNKETKGDSARATQQRKIEKDRRGKIYDDLQVQGTNNSSIVSKRSVEILYNKLLNPREKEWFGHFVPKSKRRSPAINRGYWIRIEAIKRYIEAIIEKNTGRMVEIVNLGCGYDPLPFQLLSKYGDVDGVKLKFHDIDYPDLTRKKCEMIRKSPDLMSVIGTIASTTDTSDSSIILSTDKYNLIGCDLKKGESYKAFIDNFVSSNSSVKVFVAEVSLAYMKPKYANPIIEYSSTSPNSHFIILEQVIPSGRHHSFSQRMLYHFDHLRSPIYCVEEYPTKKDQSHRFEQYFPLVEVKNLYENWDKLISFEIKRKINEIEDFDEWEEFLVFCNHYVVLHATSMDQLLFEKDKEASVAIEEQNHSVFIEHVDIAESQLFDLKFPAAAQYDGKVMVYGGLNQSRNSELVCVENGTAKIEEVSGDTPPPSMCQTLTEADGKLFLIGGRTRPSMPLASMHMFEKGVWTHRAPLPSPRARHAVVKLAETKLLIFGGLEEDDSEDLFLLYDTAADSYSRLQIVGSVENLRSCSMAYNGSFGIIVGGMSDIYTPTVNRVVYKFTIQNNAIHIGPIAENIRFGRIGCKVHFLNDAEFLVVGGTSPDFLNSQSTTIFSFSLADALFKAVPVPDPLWVQHPPVLIGFEMVQLDKSRLLILGGGAVCYSFGNAFNSCMVLNY